MSNYRKRSLLTKDEVNLVVAAGVTDRVIGQGAILRQQTARFLTVRVRASARAGGGTVTAELLYAPEGDGDYVDTGKDAVIAAADTDYYMRINEVDDKALLPLLPHLRVVLTTVTGTCTISDVDIFEA